MNNININNLKSELNNNIELLDDIIVYNNIKSYIKYLNDNILLNKDNFNIIIHLSINNKNAILLNKKNFNKKDIINIFMTNYNNNYSLLKKYIIIKKRNFNELINFINNNKKRSYVYFEKINYNNMNFYKSIIEFIESIQ